jgi:ElaB/YqjD/DUF883 family membrane-anchored ribosome-binding protein
MCLAVNPGMHVKQERREPESMSRTNLATLPATATPHADDAAKPATEALRRETRRVGEDLGRLPGLAKHAAREQLDHGRGKVQAAWDRGSERWHAAGEKVGETVKRRPVASLATVAAVGAGLGAVLGAWFSRKK